MIAIIVPNKKGRKMSLRDRINEDVKDAMKAKDAKKRDALRLLMSAFKQVEVDERKELSDEDVVKIIQTQVKRRNDAATQYRDAGRDDLLRIELDEIEIYASYLPTQLNDDELASALKVIIAKAEATTLKDIGKVMGAASKELSGKADGKRINECAKSLLS
ncbi:MAG: uncharacterized protein QG565_1383 [Campylobacterota bacterium]|nr:uncharacterized protein [Campylobacterota bacterium]MDQ1338641.1 uncharacterized protein [Campylobacterota bacterium]